MSEPIYKVKFIQQDRIYEVYARYISEESLMGFIEIDEIIFADNSNAEVTGEAILRKEFHNVRRSYLPMHTLLRIDEVSKSGKTKIEVLKSEKGKVSHFPKHKTSAPDSDDQE